MYNSFEEIKKRAQENSEITMSVAAADDEQTLLCVKQAYEKGIAKSILVGDREKIIDIAKKINLDINMPIVDEKSAPNAALAAVKIIKEGRAQVLLKGHLNSADYLKAVLNKDVGLKKSGLLSHLAAYEAPNSDKLIFSTDTGINIEPNLEEKKSILRNSISALRLLGISRPKIALLCANERVNAKMQNTVDAQALVDYFVSKNDFKGIIEGPIAMDVAASAAAAHDKGIKSEIAGEVDLFMLPDLDSGNIWSKALIYYASFKMAGVVLGATNPIVLVSRADDAQTKLDSIALACVLAKEGKVQ